MLNDEKDLTLSEIQNKLDNLIKKSEIYRLHQEIMYWNLFKQESETVADAKKRFFKNMSYDDEKMRLLQNATSLLLEEFGRIMKKNNIDYWIDFGTLIGAVRHHGWIPWDDDIDVGMLRKDINNAIDAVNKEDTYIQIKKYYCIGQGIYNIIRVMFKDENIKLFVDIFVYDYCDTNDYKATWMHYRKCRKEYVDELLQYRPKTREDDSLDKWEQKAVLNTEHIFRIEEKTSAYNEKLNIKEHDASHIIWGIDNFGYFKGHWGIFKKDIIFPLKSAAFEGNEYLCPNHAHEFLESKYGDIYKLPNDIESHSHINLTEHLMSKCKEMIQLYGS